MYDYTIIHHTVGMLLFGCVVLVAALTLDHMVETKKRDRLKEWQKGRDGTKKPKRWWE